MVLWSATAPDRVQWYFNNIRARHFIPLAMIQILAAGSSSNESLNHEINEWMRNLPEVYAAILKLELHINRFKKLLTHNLAMYHPMLRQLRQQTIAAASHNNNRIDSDSWDSWCDAASGNISADIADLPLFKMRQDQRERVLHHEHTVMKKPAAICALLKRPGAVFPKMFVARIGTKKPIKRHAFALRRVKPQKTKAASSKRAARRITKRHVKKFNKPFIGRKRYG